MSKKLNKKKQQEQAQPKTRYDRKMEARRKQAAKDKRNSIIAKTVVIVILIGIIGTAGYFITDYLVNAHKAAKDTYLTVGNHDISQLEYDYYFNSTVNDYLNTYSYFLAYMGLDTSLPYDEQNYSEDMTWQDYFEQSTIEQLKQTYALMDDADANNFEYDPGEEYDEYIVTVKETVKESNTTMRNYIKTTFGDYATKSNIRPFIENTLIASAYYEQLLEDNTPSDDEINDYYSENQHNYDKVTYYSFSFDKASYETTEDTTDDAETSDAGTTETDTEEDTANDTEDSTEENTTDDAEESDDSDTLENDAEENETDDSEDSASLAYSDAQTMAARAEDGEDFEALCYEYATDDKKDTYNTEDSEASLTSAVTATGINSLFEDWLYDDSRKEGDITIITDEESGIYYVLKFVSKEYDESCTDTISSSLSSTATDEYLTELTENYEAIDIKGEIGYLQTSDDSAEEEDSADSLLNTDIIE